MSKGVYVALSGAVAQENALEATANNVANASSAGYQRLRPIFRQALATAVGTTANDGGLRYVTTQRTALDTSLGAIRATDRPLDVALPAGVYLTALTPRGERFTRAGGLTMDREGALKTASGVPLVSDNGTPIQLQPGGPAPTITTDGTVMQGSSQVAKLKMVKFERPDALEPEGSGLLSPVSAGNMTISSEPITVGAIEESNAQPVAAMTELMAASRTFEAFQKMLDQFGEIDRKLLTSVPTAIE